MRAALENQNRLMLEGARVTEEEKAARQGLDALSNQIIAERRAEEARRLSQAEKRMEEARSRAGRSPLEDMAFLGQMLEGVRGARTFGAGLSGAAIGAGRAQTARQEALRKEEEKYDLTRNEVANLANMRQQVQLDQAKLMEARASGDANKIRAAQEKAAASQVELVKYEQSLGMKSREFELEEMKIQTQRAATSAASAEANQRLLMSLLANTEAKKQQLVKDIDKAYKERKKMVYMAADLPNATPEALQKRREADLELAEIIRQQTQDLDKLMAQTAQQIPGFGALYKSTGLPPGVTVERTGP